MTIRADQVHSRLNLSLDHFRAGPKSIREGRLKKVSGFVLEVEGLPLPIGASACILSQGSEYFIDAE